MDKRRFIRITGFWLGLALAAALCWAALGSRLKLETVEQIDGGNGLCFGIDSVQDQYRIFRADAKTGKSSVIGLPWVDERTGTDFRPHSIRFDGESGAYISLKAYRNGQTFPEGPGELEIYYCDFKRSQLSLVCSMPLEEGQDFLDFFVRPGGVLDLVLLQELTGGGKAFVLQAGPDGAIEATGEEYRVKTPVFQIRLTKDRELIYLDGEGSVYRTGLDGFTRAVYANSGIRDHNSAYLLGEDACSFYNLDQGVFMRAAYEGEGAVREADVLGEGREALGRVITLKDAGDGAFAAAVLTEDFHLLPAWFGERPVLIETVRAPLAWTAAAFFKAFGLVFLGGMALTLGYLAVRRANAGVFPVPFKLLCIAVPVAAAGYFAAGRQAEAVFYQRFELQEQRRAETALRSVGAGVEADWFRKPSENILRFEAMTLYRQARSTENNGIFGPDGGYIGDEDTTPIEYSFYSRDGDGFYQITKSSLACTPVGYTVYGANDRPLNACVKENTVVMATQKTVQEGTILELYLPVWDGPECVGAIRAVIDMELLMDSVRQAVAPVKWTVFGVLAAVLLVLLAIAAVSLGPLLGLVREARAMAAGGLEGLKKGGKHRHGKEGRGEISEMEQVYRRMEEHLDRQLREMEEIKAANEPFVPRRLLELLGKEDARSLKPGDEAALKTAVMAVNAGDFEKVQAQVGARELFGFVDGAFKRMIPPVNREGGVAERFQDAGMTVLWPQGPAGCLRASVEAVRELRRGRPALGGKPVAFSAGIAMGEVRLAVIGNGERMEVVSVSPYSRLAKGLQELAAQCRAGIFVTGTAWEAASGEKRPAGVRFLGHIWLKEQARAEALYEIYEADPKEEAVLKEGAGPWLKAGAALFEKRQWAGAREQFAKVLRANPQDGPAGRYFSLCDRYLEHEPGEEGPWFWVFGEERED